MASSAAARKLGIGVLLAMRRWRENARIFLARGRARRLMADQQEASTCPPGHGPAGCSPPITRHVGDVSGRQAKVARSWLPGGASRSALFELCGIDSFLYITRYHPILLQFEFSQPNL